VIDTHGITRSFVTATKFYVDVAETKHFAAATKRFVIATKDFVTVKNFSQQF